MMEAKAGSSLSRHMTVALVAVFILVGGFGTAAAVIKINGAVIASGRIVVESSVKRVQHREGGIVKEINVREGQLVEANDLLVRLDDTLARANLSIIDVRLQELLVQEARLRAERDGQDEIITPAALESYQSEPEVAAVLEGQRALLNARLLTRQGQRSQLSEQIKQFEEQIIGLSAQRDAKAEEMELIAEEYEDFSGLFKKGLVPKTRMTNLKRDKARLAGEHGGFVSQIAQVGQSISERKIQILQIDENMRTEVVEQLQAVRAEIGELTERKVAAEEQLRRVEVRAPRAGYVHQLSVHTVGGVVAPGEDLMAIVPKADLLVIEANVAPTDVDQLALAQDAVVRLPGFDQRTTPELHANILSISADLFHDPATNMSFYQVRLEISEDEIARLGERSLLPGMPVEAFVQTGSRTILSYLVKPLTDHFVHAFREG